MVFKRKIERKLKEWHAKKEQKPLILRGARQVGKSTLVRNFGKSFSYYIELNLEKSSDISFFESYGDDVNSILDAILLDRNLPKDYANTLLFIDEIQESTDAIKLLRYFYEELPDLHVIAAGSLLEFAINKVSSFPVGRVVQLAIHPMDFEEFLMAMGEEQALKYLNTIPVPEFAIPKLIELFHEYARVGGMPEIVKNYVGNNKSLISLQDVYSSIWDNYLDDVEKYSTNDTQRRIIRQILQAAPNVRDRITYSNFAGIGYKSREVSECMNMLDLSKLIRIIHPTTSINLPISTEMRRKPKIQFLDTGLLNYAAGIQSKLIQVKDLNSLYKGYIVNHLVNQELIAKETNVRFKPHFWVRENANSNAEVDVVIEHKELVIPIEIKSGAKGSLRSLHEFIDRTNHDLGIRLLANNILVETSKTRTNREFTLLNLPYFLASKLGEYVEWCNNE